MATPGCTSYPEADFTFADGIYTSAIQRHHHTAEAGGRLYFYRSMRLNQSLGKSAGGRIGGKQRRPAKPGDLAPVFAALRTLLQPYQGELVPQTDQPDYFCLESKTATYRNRPMYFAGVLGGRIT